MKGDFDAQINRTMQLTNELRDDRLEAELRGIKRQRDELQDQLAELRGQRSLHLGELKALCSHLADELDDEDGIYKSGVESIQLWAQQLQRQGLSESEIDEKVARRG